MTLLFNEPELTCNGLESKHVFNNRDVYPNEYSRINKLYF